MVNKANCLYLAALIERQPHAEAYDKHGFNMHAYNHDCGTPSCICGFAFSLLHPGEDLRKVKEETVERVGAEYLGLDKWQTSGLFYPDHPLQWCTITPQQAAATLRHLGETGQVEWQLCEAQ